jgi:GT2 family glycosyltransferase
LNERSGHAGVVVIGRNEGQRLKLCLDSVAGRGLIVIYVDSGSTDGSIELATSTGAATLVLDPTTRYSAARARNEGYMSLLSRDPAVEYVQFVDGDCSIAEGWLKTAIAFLDANPRYAAVCGRRRERSPQASIYNHLADLEWDTPVGDAVACGGDVLIRIKALTQVGGFNGSVIAGEEPELCVRLREAGWEIFRMNAEMTLHDAAMTRFGQWCRRTMRGGYAYALGASMHGSPPERHWVRETRSIVFWGLVLPLASIVLLWPTRGFSACMVAAYALLGWRIFRRMRSRDFSVSEARVYALFCVLGKFPQAVGVLRFWSGCSAARPSSIMEYKPAAAAAQS